MIMTVRDWERVGKNATLGFARIAWEELQAAAGEKKELPLLTRDGQRVKDGSGSESRLFVTVKAQIDS